MKCTILSFVFSFIFKSILSSNNKSIYIHYRYSMCTGVAPDPSSHTMVIKIDELHVIEFHSVSAQSLGLHVTRTSYRGGLIHRSITLCYKWLEG